MDVVEVTMSFLKGAILATAGAVVLLMILKRVVKKPKWIVPLVLLFSAIVAFYVALTFKQNLCYGCSHCRDLVF